MHQLTEGASIEEIENAGLGAYYTDHGLDVYPQSAAGMPFTAAYIACKGDPIANLQENLAADKKDFKCNLHKKISIKWLKIPRNKYL